MSSVSLEQIATQFKEMERSELDKLVFECAKAHIQLCELTDVGSQSKSHHHDQKHKEESHHTHAHASENEIKERIKAKDKNDLVQILSSITAVQCCKK
jgi:ABC-type nickel/cobalt efflux system permease component RcnA